MPILIRYILSELAKVFSVTLAAMTVLMLLVGVLKEAMQQGLGVMQVARIAPYLLPEALRFAVPATILLSVCSVYGRMASSNEVVAVKSFGISPLVLLWPTFILAFLLSLATVWLNDAAVSWGRVGAQRVIVQSVEEIAYGMLRAQRSFSNKQFSINVKRVEDRKLIGPTLSFQPTPTSRGVTVTAEEAELRTDPRSNTLTIRFRNGVIDAGHQTSMVFPDTFDRVIPLSDAARLAEVMGPSNLPMSVIHDEVAKQKATILGQEQQLAALAAYQMGAGDFAALADPQWGVLRIQLADQKYRLYRLQTEPHRRWANGFSCLCFAMIGVPTALWRKNSGFLATFFLCFAPILILYYPMLIGSVDLAKSGTMPPYCVWAGNAILLAAGVWLVRREVRH